MLGDYSSALTGCQLDDFFGVLGMSHPVMGRRLHSSRSGRAKRPDELRRARGGSDVSVHSRSRNAPAAQGPSFLGKAGPLVLARLVHRRAHLSIPLVLARVL